MASRMNVEELQAFLAREFSQVDGQFTILAAGEAGVRLRLNAGEAHLRPGGTVSGPTMFALADVSMYLAILALIGPKALTVTTNCCIDFMRKPAPGDLIGEARVLKLGRQLAVGDVMIFSEGVAKPVARASLTYSIPPRG